MIGDHLEWPRVRCCMGDDEHCICPNMERAMRSWSRGDQIPAMTEIQRNFCLDEIGRVEGYVRAEHEHVPDGQLARDVLSAWTDYAQDKGLM